MAKLSDARLASDAGVGFCLCFCFLFYFLFSFLFYIFVFFFVFVATLLTWQEHYDMNGNMVPALIQRRLGALSSPGMKLLVAQAKDLEAYVNPYGL